METLLKKHRILISQTNTDIVREIMKSVNWEKQLVSIRGSRGVGKTTLMRQYIKQKYGVNAGEALYCLMDSMYFASHTLMEVAERFHLMGGKHLFLDEVHKYPTWSKELKEINDLWPDMKITFTGSSLLQILNADADLSRRVLSYDMAGLSFREYLRFYKSIELPVHTLQEALEDAEATFGESSAKIDALRQSLQQGRVAVQQGLIRADRKQQIGRLGRHDQKQQQAHQKFSHSILPFRALPDSDGRRRGTSAH